MRRRGIALGGVIVDPGSAHGDFFQGRGQPEWLAADLGAHLVGGVFPCPADCHLHQRSRQRCEHHHQQRTDQPKAFTRPAEEQRKIGQHRDRAGKGRGNGHDRGVIVADVGQLMCDHPGQLLSCQAAQQARGHGHRRIFGVAPGGKSIGLRRVDQIDLGLGHPGVSGQIRNHSVQPHPISRCHRLGIVHPQHHAVGVPPCEGIHRRGHHQGDHRAACPADQIADAHEQRGHCRHQHCRFYVAHCCLRSLNAP